MTKRRPLVSIIVPALNEADNVAALIKRYCQFPVENPDYDFELVVIDDGSVDGTAQRVVDLAPPEERVTVVRLSRNFGSHYATSAGFANCAGDCAIMLGADLQEPASLIADFLANWRAGSEVVWGIRRLRVGRSALAELQSKAFSWLFAKFTDLKNYPAEGPSGVLVDRIVIDELNKMEEQNRNTLALVAWLGFTQTRVSYDQEPRRNGESRWTRRKMIKLAVDSLIQFSSMPLRACTYTGITVALLGLAYALLLIGQNIAGTQTPSGWPTILVIMLFIGGAQLAMIGIMGEYLWRGVEESRRRPHYVLRSVDSSGPARPAPRPAMHAAATPHHAVVPAPRTELQPTIIS
ncbi:glycosyltransferase family 2 protein [Catellatospora paridis]|uniref:glycosyltransferase family 2 protein n=1 Tax=Catellatospora paridis TaxID=1617086 RepID=UPI0018AFAA5F|nr:glycosyltransferase family 2 protein [Catellatospora paridis]